jgi:transposase InsO family protein
MDVRMLVATLPEGVVVAEWCRRLEISRQTFYKWRSRYLAEGEAGLVERSRAAHHPAGRVSAALEDEVVRVRKARLDQGLDAGPGSIWDDLDARGLDPPSPSTVWRILVRRGQVTPEPGKRPRPTWRRFERERPNECWQMDDTHWTLATPDGPQEVAIINGIDDHSRVCVLSVAVAVTTSARVCEAFTAATVEWGVPQAVLTDNGRPYTSGVGQRAGLFQLFLAQLEVTKLRSRPFHPQTCGKVERFHQTLKRWLAAQEPARTITELQAKLDDFRRLYNHQRRHRALDRRTPASVWAATPRATPVRSATSPEPRIELATVTANGSVYVGRAIIIIGVRHAHRPVTIVRRGNDVTVIDSHSAEVLRSLTFEAGRRSYPSGRKRGGPRQPRLAEQQ